MPTQAEILTRYGIKRPEVTIRAAREAGLELAVACAMLMGESGGGRMVWGSDAVQTGGTYSKGGPVTRENYLAYRAAMRAGKIGRQGCGDCQLTSAEFQDRGDALGGCWTPYANQLAGFQGLASRIRASGLYGGLRRYNGSGPAAEAYAARRVAEAAVWRARLAGASTEEDDDMARVDQNEWNAVRDAILAAIKPWGGGLSDVDDMATAVPYTPLQFLLRNNVEAHQALLTAQRCQKQLDRVEAALTLQDARLAAIAERLKS